jgi:hypothetical protein
MQEPLIVSKFRLKFKATKGNDFGLKYDFTDEELDENSSFMQQISTGSNTEAEWRVVNNKSLIPRTQKFEVDDGVPKFKKPVLS